MIHLSRRSKWYSTVQYRKKVLAVVGVVDIPRGTLSAKLVEILTPQKEGPGQYGHYFSISFFSKREIFWCNTFSTGRSVFLFVRYTRAGRCPLPLLYSRSTKIEQKETCEHRPPITRVCKLKSKLAATDEKAALLIPPPIFSHRSDSKISVLL